jgi:hypothetical protein
MSTGAALLRDLLRHDPGCPLDVEELLVARVADAIKCEIEDGSLIFDEDELGSPLNESPSFKPYEDLLECVRGPVPAARRARPDAG